MSKPKPTPAVLDTTFVCNQGRPHLIVQGCTCKPRSSR